MQQMVKQNFVSLRQSQKCYNFYHHKQHFLDLTPIRPHCNFHFFHHLLVPCATELIQTDKSLVIL